MSLYHHIGSELPEEHAVFYTTQLPFLPVVTLDVTGRPWGSILAGTDGKPGFVRNSRSKYNTLSIDAKLWPGEPLLKNAETFKEDGSMLVAGIGVEYSTRRRNKFAGKVTKLEKDDDEVHFELCVDEALGNCPKYITIRDLIPYSNTSPTITSQNLDFGPNDRLPDKAISLILESDTVFLGTTYAAPADEASHFPSHLGMNQRGGRKGFVRVLPSDGRTIVLPDFSGNRFMTSLGNIEATPFASLTFISFPDGSILYLTGIATNIIGSAAQRVMPLHTQNALTTIQVTGFSLVSNALPVRQRPGSTSISSPYSPPVRFLAEEPGGTSMMDSAIVRLTKIEMHSSTIATFSWAPSETLSILPGQAAILDFTPLLGARGYQHMAPLEPTSVNDDRIRTWTVSSVNADETFSLTMREKPGGAVTGALFNIARRLQEVRPELLEDSRPMGLSVGLVGVTGSFILPPPPKTAFLWLTGGIGVTPFLAMLRGLNPAFEYDIQIILSVREPVVFIPLLSEAVRARGSKKGKITIDVFSERDVPEVPEEGVILRRHKGRISTEALKVSTGEKVGTLEKGVSLPEREVYICGSPSFEEAALNCLIDLGLDRTSVRREGFTY
ncbi:Flavohemoprotein [Termitomyces sp. T112]|nr:Flavohemoprotein [Termitomyces sp. T112]KNZ77275.1 Flavohemoprotein [Termitomyces sp. J132]